MRIYRHKLHCLLVKFPGSNFSTSWFGPKKSAIRQDLERLRIDDEIHKREEYRRLFSYLDDAEMLELMAALRKYIHGSNKLSDMSLADNHMIHHFMSDCLIEHTLDNHPHDAFMDVLNEYYTALGLELHYVTDKKNRSSIQIWLQYVTDNPFIYINHLFDDEGNEYRFKQLGLSECGCVDISHDRLLSDVRKETEEFILAQCKRHCELYPNKTLKLLSFGPGEGLQDFILLFKLFSMNMLNVEITFIEPKYRLLSRPDERNMRENWQKDWQHGMPLPEKYCLAYQEDNYNIIRALSLLTKCFPAAKLAISQYADVSQLKVNEHRDEYDVIYAIDMEDYEDGNKVKTAFNFLSDCLSPHGVAVVSHHYQVEKFRRADTQGQAATFESIEVKNYVKPDIVGGGYITKHSLNHIFKY